VSQAEYEADESRLKAKCDSTFGMGAIAPDEKGEVDGKLLKLPGDGSHVMLQQHVMTRAQGACIVHAPADLDEQWPKPWHSCAGVKVPMGKGENSNVKGSLVYNEFIVYDTAQIRQKYVLKVKFVFNK